MKREILLVLLPMLIGCSTISYQNEQGEKVSYSRLGSQNLSGVTIAKDGSKVAVKIASQRTNAEEMASAASKIAEAASTFVKQ